MSLNKLIATFDGAVADVPDEYVDIEQFWFDELAHVIAGCGERGINALFSRVGTADELHLAAILMHVPAAKRKRRRFHDLVAKHLYDTRPVVVQAAIDAATQLRYRDLFSDILMHVYSRSPFVVGAVLRFLGRYHSKLALPILIGALKAPDPIIICSAVDELTRLGATSALPAIGALVDHETPKVRETAETAIESLKSVSSHAK